MRLFVVLCHPEPASFNATLVRALEAAAPVHGCELRVSDLYASGFNPVLDRATWQQHRPGRFPGAHEALPPDIQAEVDCLFWCDALVLQFPLWCFGLPAMLKGWLDRVIVTEPISGGGRFFHRGVFAGKRAMCSLSTSGSANEYAPYGLHGDIHQILRPVHHGIFAATGFTPIEPFIAWGVSKQDAAARDALRAHGVERILGIQKGAPIAFPPLTDYDETLQWKHRPRTEPAR